MLDFHFNTKAQNLKQLKGIVSKAIILDLYIIKKKAWVLNHEKIINDIIDRFTGESGLIVRSSALSEDSVNSSLAGAYDSIQNVGLNSLEISDAVEAVFRSYYGTNSQDEVLVQPMLCRAEMSGVVFTRDLDTNAPYYVINYDDETNFTDQVTAGASINKLVRIFKYAKTEILDQRFKALIELCQELESITRNDSLDVEFAFSQGKLFLLQVRPIVKTKVTYNDLLDKITQNKINRSKEMVTTLQRRINGVYGYTTIFGEMPDWNPAEIIGVKPKPLSFSLYNYIIMDSAWREARGMMGYFNPVSTRLMVSISGHPYVDVRNSFNSLMPANLSPVLSEKLIGYYLDKLKKNPKYHDKVEFEVLFTCLSFDFNVKSKELEENGFTGEEIEELRIELLRLTDDIVNDRNGLLTEMKNRLDELALRRGGLELVRSISEIPVHVKKLLDDCRYYGTIPFSIFARNAFIGNAFLKSLVFNTIITEQQYHDFLNSIETVTSEFVKDLSAYKTGGISKEHFINKYGHLRPGTYDITIDSYREKFDIYLNDAKESASVRKIEYHFDHCIIKSIQHKIAEYGFTFSAQRLIEFIRESIKLRELFKFEFTKNLSLALDLIREFGMFYGFDKEEVAFLEIEDIVRYAYETLDETASANLKKLIEINNQSYEQNNRLYFPELIMSEADIEQICYQTQKPNYITNKSIRAEIINLSRIHDLKRVDFSGKAVLIENADPGFDWLFSKDIGALITKYGGAASHMAIRCAEFGIPAAIGCGEIIYSSLENKHYVLLHCGEKRVKGFEAV